MLSIVKASVSLVKAFDLASHECYQESLDVLEKNKSTLNGNDEEFHILKSFLLLKVSNPRKSIENAKIACTLIAKNKKMNNDERIYLKIYLSLICEKAYNIIGEKSKAQNAQKAYMDEKVDMLNVNNALKRNFPLKESVPSDCPQG